MKIMEICPDHDVEMLNEEEAKNSNKSSENVSPDKEMNEFETPQRKKKRHENKSDSNAYKKSESPGMNIISGSKTEPIENRSNLMLINEESGNEIKHYLTSTKNEKRKLTKISHLNSLSAMIGNVDYDHEAHENSEMYPQIIFHSPYCPLPEQMTRRQMYANNNLSPCFQRSSVNYQSEEINSEYSHCQNPN